MTTPGTNGAATRVRSARTTCPACGGGEFRSFFETKGVPVHCNILYPTAVAARSAPRGDILLAFCEECGLIFNEVFDPSLTAYSESYENSLYFSPAFQEYAEWLTGHLVEAFDLHDKDLVEIGCGSAEFLNALCERGGNRGYGFDPSAPPSRFPNVTIVPEFYGPGQAGHPADAVFSRHVLEHVADPGALLSDVHSAVATGTPVYCEVPNGRFILEDVSVWDVIYEHPSYFTSESLKWLMGTSGFVVSDSYTAFGEQFLAVEARAVESLERAVGPNLADLTGLVDRFGAAQAEAVERWTDRCGAWISDGVPVALWGAGSKGVTFLNTIAGADQLRHVVDVNPRKHGKCVPGTGQPVVGPDSLVADPPAVVLVMNPLYRDEIADHLDAIGINAAVEVV